MADEKKTPQDAVDTEQATAHEDSAQAAEKKDFVDSVSGAADAGRTLLERLFPGHANEALFALVGLIVALLFLTFGFWRMMLVLLMIVAGIAFGQYLDGDPKIINKLKEIFQSSDKS